MGPISLLRRSGGAVLITISLLASLASAAPTVSNTTSTVSNSTTTASNSTRTVSSTMLIFARDTASSYSATSGFNSYGIPFELVIVPSAGVALPTLNSSTTQGNYGGILVLSELAYSYSSGWASALTAAQWTTLFNYQLAFGVRMVRLDAYPGPDFGTTTAIAGAGCCDTKVEQLVSFSNTTGFPTANLKTGAGVTTQGLWHYPATITNSSMAWEIAQFAPSTDGTFSTASTAAVVNNIGGRLQQVWFTSWASDWSMTSTYLQHAYIHFLTRGLYVGRRRIYFSTQIDDVGLGTSLYTPNGTIFRVRPADLDAHVTWMPNINARLPAGSNYTIELAHNGNGALEEAIYQQGGAGCVTDDPIEYIDPPLTTLEFQKPIGTGTDVWPTTPEKYVTSYSWTLACNKLDGLAAWFSNSANLNNFAHISHTFTHEALDNATLADTDRQIVFNQAWLKQIGISAAKHFSPQGLIPPAITGMHNGDAINAWMKNGINHVVGDNTRSVLMNSVNEHWPLVSTVASNGYDGLTIMPRWATTIFYNCDFANCTLTEWINTSGGAGTFSDLLDNARSTNVRHLFSLRHDPFMFHQANLRQTDVPSITVGTQSGQLSLLQTWVETVMQEFTRLATWPVITLTHDTTATYFLNRMAQDQCSPKMTWNYAAGGKTITGVIVTATGNTCSVPIPVTFPVSISTAPSGATKEQIGTDTPTLWFKLSGSPVTYTLPTPVTV